MYQYEYMFEYMYIALIEFLLTAIKNLIVPHCSSYL